jgi:hypothetical protein
MRNSRLPIRAIILDYYHPPECGESPICPDGSSVSPGQDCPEPPIICPDGSEVPPGEDCPEPPGEDPPGEDPPGEDPPGEDEEAGADEEDAGGAN